jgi:hypothetical protein
MPSPTSQFSLSRLLLSTTMAAGAALALSLCPGRNEPAVTGTWQLGSAYLFVAAGSSLFDRRIATVPLLLGVMLLTLAAIVSLAL